MHPLKKIMMGSLGRLSPEMADHSLQLGLEAYVTAVHVINWIRCRRRFRSDTGLCLNLGCGPHPKSGCVNLDFSKWADFRIDLRRSLPFPDGSCRLVFSEHFLEHLPYPEGVEKSLGECFRVLEPGGRLVLSVPDTDWPLSNYQGRDNDWVRCCEERDWHPVDCTTYMEHLNYHFRQRWRGMSYGHFENHRFAWDFETMTKKLSEAGFAEVREREFDPSLDSNHRRAGSLLVEAVKR